MVLFENVMLNQQVEVLKGNQVYRGVVRFKGIINGKPGDWVGVEMNEPVGRGNGMVNGRRYFAAMEGHALFTPASHIRFIPQPRFSFNRYRPIRSDEPNVDEDLFDLPPRTLYEDDYMDRGRTSWVNKSYIDNDFYQKYSDYDDAFPVRRVYPRRHSISSVAPPASARWSEPRDYRPHTSRCTAARPCCTHYCQGPREGFITPSSIPHTHMPHSCMKREVLDDWSHTSHLPRYYTVNTARHSLANHYRY